LISFETKFVTTYSLSRSDWKFVDERLALIRESTIILPSDSSCFLISKADKSIGGFNHAVLYTLEGKEFFSRLLSRFYVIEFDDMGQLDWRSARCTCATMGRRGRCLHGLVISLKIRGRALTLDPGEENNRDWKGFKKAAAVVPVDSDSSDDDGVNRPPRTDVERFRSWIKAELCDRMFGFATQLCSCGESTVVSSVFADILADSDGIICPHVGKSCRPAPAVDVVTIATADLPSVKWVQCSDEACGKWRITSERAFRQFSSPTAIVLCSLVGCDCPADDDEDRYPDAASQTARATYLNSAILAPQSVVP